jgi:hypothetical protein
MTSFEARAAREHLRMTSNRRASFFSRRFRARVLFDSFPQKRGAERRKAHPTNVRAFSGRGSAPRRQVYAVCALICFRGALALRRSAAALVSESQPPLAQLQNHVSWDAAGAGVLPASGLSSPASSSQTGPFAGQVVPRSRPGAEYIGRLSNNTLIYRHKSKRHGAGPSARLHMGSINRAKRGHRITRAPVTARSQRRLART